MIVRRSFSVQRMAIFHEKVPLAAEMYDVKLKINNVNFSLCTECLVFEILRQRRLKSCYAIQSNNWNLSNDLIGQSHILARGRHYDGRSV